jgi:LysM repeat protein
MNYRKYITGIFIIILTGTVGCRTYRPATAPIYTEQSTESYIERYSSLAIREMERTGVPASITLAQGMIESDYGRSRLAREGNNHFGIKCHNTWKGATMRHNDDSRNECFRKYNTPEESFIDHSDFLLGTRYRPLFKNDPTDYKEWARGLKRYGYATNPDYANMLIRKIEQYGLYNYDRGRMATVSRQPVIEKTTPDQKDVVIAGSETEKEVNEPRFNNSFAVSAVVPRIMENNRIQYIIVRDGDTREKLEKDFQLLKWELVKYNDINGELTLKPGQILYLQPKRDKAEPGKEYHICREGETMYLISQQYGLKLKSLYALNRMQEGTEPVAGQRLSLRIIKPVN